MLTPWLALTPGDPAGSGPEIVARFLAESRFGAMRPLVFGDRRVLERAAEVVEAALDWHEVDSIEDLEGVPSEAIALWPVPWHGAMLPAWGQVDARAGEHAYRILEATAPLLRRGQLPGVVTGPLCKEAIQLVRPGFIGHTEFYAEVSGTEHFGMLLVVEPLRALHVTTHVALRDVPALLSPERILATLELAHIGLEQLGEARRAIGVCALNPHAGEAGSFGDEEARVIAPAIAAARARGWNVVGPVPPDTVFARAMAGEFALVVCMYHDQGHIPLKLVGFDRGVNVTIGLDFVRTSVDHGTAFDLAGTGRARFASLKAAWDLAEQLCRRRFGATPTP